MRQIPSVKGFRDVLPGESARWAALEARAREIFAAYNFDEIRLPIVERTELFRRSIGETTDIVEKEMYTFIDRDDTSLTLRPEGTASAVRAYVESGLYQRDAVSKLFYFGPMFRRERPQRGRLRQFYQIGAEVFGREDAAADAEVLTLLSDLLQAFGIDNAEIQVSSLGCRACRPAYRAVLIEWGRAHFAELCEDCRRRLDQNPLRLLDCKNAGCIALRHSAPRPSEYWCEACREHLERVLDLLRAVDLTPRREPYMVRGLDYYCRTAFEVVSSGLGAQNAVGGGGRYDGLVKALGGPDVAGVGFALGVERLVMLLGEAAPESRPELVILPLGERAEVVAASLAHRWRRGGARVEIEPAGKSLKSQMRRADKLGARYAFILGDEELSAAAISVRDLEARCNYPRAVRLEAPLAEVRATLDELRLTSAERRA